MNKQKQPQNISTIYASKMEVLLNNKTLIAESDIVINSNTKYVVLGANGIGKSLMATQIYNTLHNDIDILMIDQDIKLDDVKSPIFEFILTADIELYEIWKKYKALENTETDDDMQSYEKYSQELFVRGWDKYDAESKRILAGLGFRDLMVPVSILSGGQRMILAIGKALLRQPEVLILDEPTNHLDLNNVIWLTNYLETYKKTLIIITHQINLTNICDVIWYIGNLEFSVNKLYTIRGNYSNLLKFKEQTYTTMVKAYEKYEKRLTELKKKSLPKSEIELFIKKEKPCERPPKPYIVNILFNDVNELPTKYIIEFSDVSFKYNPNDLNYIYKHLNMRIDMGSRIVLVGPNGCGKTTLFKLAIEQVRPTSGNIYHDDRLRIGYYNQQIVDSLPSDLNAIEYLRTIDTSLSLNECRATLAKVGIKKTDAVDLPMNKIIDLSGGQKARVAFAVIQIQNPHLLLLDEPTNHLDIESINGLITGLNSFNGAIIVITHDMYLIESINDSHIYEINDGNIIKFPGDFADYCDKIVI
jgi:ATP-binding cassette subfamily F protein 1